jgi:signal transduction histidine kinase
VVTPEETMVGGWAIDITGEQELRQSASSSLEKRKMSEEEREEIKVREHQLMDMKSRFVTMASHEFRTPLSTILSSVHLLEKYTTAEQQSNRMRHAGKIKESVHHIDSLLEDFLSIGRLAEGKVAVYPTAVSLREVIGETISSLEMLKKAGQQVVASYSGDDQLITDRKLLRNIISNLLSNALKFSGEQKTNTITADHSAAGVTITVKDQGIGISKEDQAHLFETFYRARNVQNIQGTGLGLHIVKQYVQMLQGTIGVESEIGVGTTVIVSLPLHSKL